MKTIPKSQHHNKLLSNLLIKKSLFNISKIKKYINKSKILNNDLDNVYCINEGNKLDNGYDSDDYLGCF